MYDIRKHYEIERELASRLRNANSEERRRLYSVVYDELFRRIPDHPNLISKQSPKEKQERANSQLAFLRRFLLTDTVFLELGPGDCALSFAVAPLVKSVYAVDVSKILTENEYRPPNFRLILSDGVSVPVEPGSINVAYSNQLMEHLHPDDAVDQVRQLFRALAPRGIYVCITPHRFSGPHDVSRHFDTIATGFHLKEYTIAELSQLFRSAGFRKVNVYLGLKKRYVRCTALANVSERAIGSLHGIVRYKIANLPPVQHMLEMRLVAEK